jgi:hypothetical protein
VGYLALEALKLPVAAVRTIMGPKASPDSGRD